MRVDTSQANLTRVGYMTPNGFDSLVRAAGGAFNTLGAMQQAHASGKEVYETTISLAGSKQVSLIAVGLFYELD